MRLFWTTMILGLLVLGLLIAAAAFDAGVAAPSATPDRPPAVPEAALAHFQEQA